MNTACHSYYKGLKFGAIPLDPQGSKGYTKHFSFSHFIFADTLLHCGASGCEFRIYEYNGTNVNEEKQKNLKHTLTWNFDLSKHTERICQKIKNETNLKHLSFSLNYFIHTKAHIA